MKICIVGPSGAGKSTILKVLASEFNIPGYEFDEIYWNLSSESFIRNSDEYMNECIDKILHGDQWIVEGAYDKRMAPFFTECSLILKVDIPFWLRTMRLLKRFLVSKRMGKRPRETLLNTFHLIKFSYGYDKKLNKFLSDNSLFFEKTVIVHNESSCVNTILKLRTY